MPHGGVGLRALKYLSHDEEILKLVNDMPLPEIGINYRATIQHSISNNLLDLEPANQWFGQTLDENGIKYKFWFRVSCNNGRLEILMRYDPEKYAFESALRIVSDAKENFRYFLQELLE
jgi:hypothetical protein